MLTSLSFCPHIDLFASRINYQLEKYVSFKPDPGAFAIDAFTTDWANLKLYAFPPFNVIPMVLRKIQADKATGICVFLNWPTHAWFPKATAMVLQDPTKLKPNKNLFSMASWRSDRAKQYSTYLSSWESYCDERNIHKLQPGIENVLVT